jgi:LysM repeat protein
MVDHPLTAAPPEARVAPPPGSARPDIANAAHGACPYLLAAGGAWRSTLPSIEHRCTAVAPAARLSAEKQRRLCLTTSHPTCATYIAALEARRERGTPAEGQSPIRWAVARTTPVVDVGAGLGATVVAVLLERRGWQAIPAIVLVLAVAAIGVSGFGRDRSLTGTVPSASPSGAPSSSVTPNPSVSPTPGPSGSPEPSPTLPSTGSAAPTLVASPAPASPPPSARTSYTVKSGDTLYGIAQSFGTSVTAIKQLNGLSSNVIHAGQVLLIP